MDLFGAFLTQEGDDVLGGRTTDDGVVDDNDLFAFYSCLQNGELEADRHLTGSLCALDKCSSDIAVLKKCLTIRNAAFKSITDRSRDTGVRSRYDKVCIAGVFTGQRTSCLYTGLINARTVDEAVRSCQINELEDTEFSVLMCIALRYCINRRITFFRDRNDLTRQNVADGLGADGVKCTVLGSQKIHIIFLSEYQRTKSERIADTDDTVFTHQKDRIRTLDLAHHLLDRAFERIGRNAVSGKK